MSDLERRVRALERGVPAAMRLALRVDRNLNGFRGEPERPRRVVPGPDPDPNPLRRCGSLDLPASLTLSAPGGRSATLTTPSPGNSDGGNIVWAGEIDYVLHGWPSNSPFAPCRTQSISRPAASQSRPIRFSFTCGSAGGTLRLSGSSRFEVFRFGSPLVYLPSIPGDGCESGGEERYTFYTPTSWTAEPFSAGFQLWYAANDNWLHSNGSNIFNPGDMFYVHE